MGRVLVWAHVNKIFWEISGIFLTFYQHFLLQKLSRLSEWCWLLGVNSWWGCSGIGAYIYDTVNIFLHFLHFLHFFIFRLSEWCWLLGFNSLRWWYRRIYTIQNPAAVLPICQWNIGAANMPIKYYQYRHKPTYSTTAFKRARPILKCSNWKTLEKNDRSHLKFASSHPHTHHQETGKHGQIKYL